jgi:thiol-disulfide isomerase/thioredoxin
MNYRFSVLARFTGPVVLMLSSASLAAAPPTVEQVLSLRPAQRFVECDMPDAQTAAGCKVEVVSEGKATGWVLRDNAGRIYRRFMDMNRDNVVDQWRYFQNGVEVYRDLDTNANGRPDQHRWLESGGTRWAFDSNEDGKIDGYRVLSAEEATREVVRALAMRDPSMIEPVLLRAADANLIGTAATAEQIRQANAAAAQRFQELSGKLAHLTAESRWVRFDGAMPMLIPGDAADGSRDVQVYRNVNVVVQTAERIDVLKFGQLVQIGRVWKILDLPTIAPADSLAARTVFANVPATTDAPPTGPAADPAVQAMLTELQKLDEAAAKNPRNDSASARYQLERATVLGKLAQQAKAEPERTEWRRQLADSLIAALQVEPAPATEQRLKQLADSIREEDADSPLVSYIAFRQLSADYSRKIQQPGSDFAAVQKEWLEQLEQFVTDFPKSEDTAEALAQLAVGMEFAGKEDDAKKYYQKLADTFPESPSAKRGQGALKRLELDGKPLALKGADLRRGTLDIEKLKGKVVLVQYWATWCEPCKADLPRLKEIYGKYRSKGFEVIGVSLDNDKAEVSRFVQSAGLTWPILFEPGGLDSPPAAQYGIIALPTQLLVDAEGKVVSRTVTVSQLEDELKKLLK